MKLRNQGKPRGFSLLELLTVGAIVGVLALLVVPRFMLSDESTMLRVRNHHKAMINQAVERYYIENNTWPSADLSDIGADRRYFPDGLPTDPFSGSKYSLNTTTHRVD